jgi:hypothetical protein
MINMNLENQIFDWESWDEGRMPMTIICIGVKLKVPVGEFPVGHEFESAYIDGELSRVTFYEKRLNIGSNSIPVSHTFDLKMSVGEKIDPIQDQVNHGYA